MNRPRWANVVLGVLLFLGVAALSGASALGVAYATANGGSTSEDAETYGTAVGLLVSIVAVCLMVRSAYPPKVRDIWPHYIGYVLAAIVPLGWPVVVYLAYLVVSRRRWQAPTRREMEKDVDRTHYGMRKRLGL